MEHAVLEAGIDENEFVQAIVRDGEDDPALRPKDIESFVGQERARKELRVALKAAYNRGETLGHVLIFGPAGLGKTTLAHIIANESGGTLRSVMASVISRAGDLAHILVSLQENDVLFLDEIHRLPADIEEILYSAMEDRKLSVMTGDGLKQIPVIIQLNHFTLVGATTRSGMLSQPLKDRFFIDLKLELYPEEELADVVDRSANILNLNISRKNSLEIAKRSRGTPRIANRLLKRIRDFIPEKQNTITQSVLDESFEILKINEYGLDRMQQEYMEALAVRFKGKATALETLSAALGENSQTLEEEIEPWLIRQGFIDKTPRGRVLAHNAAQLGYEVQVRLI